MAVACNRKELRNIKCLKYGSHLKNTLWRVSILLDSSSSFAQKFSRELYFCSSPTYRAHL